MHWGAWIKWGTALTVSGVASCWPVDVVLKEDPPAATADSVRFMHHYLAHVKRKTPANIAVVQIRGLPYVVAKAFGEGKALGMRRVQPPLLVDLSHNARKLAVKPLPAAVAHELGRGPERDKKYAVPAIDAATIASLASGDDIERLGKVELRVPNAEPIVTVRAGSIVFKPDPPATPESLSWSASIIGQTGHAEFRIAPPPLGAATISETTSTQSALIAPMPTADSTHPEYAVEQTLSLAETSSVASPTPTPAAPIVQNSVETEGESPTGCFEDKKGTAPNPPAADTVTVRVLPVVTQAVSQSNVKIDGVIGDDGTALNNALFWSGIRIHVEFLPAAMVSDQDFGVTSDTELIAQLLRASDLFQRAASQVLTAQELGRLVPAYKQLNDLRHGAHADVAVVLQATTPKGLGGWTPAIPANDTLFYSMVFADTPNSISGDGNTLEHEVGHLLGGRHNIEQPFETVPPTSHGYLFKIYDSKQHEAHDVGTMMTRAAKRVILRYSNLESNPCNGDKLGIPRLADEATTMNSNGVLVARLHDQPGSVEPPAANVAVCRSVLLARSAPDPRSCGAKSPTVFYFDAGQYELPAAEGDRADAYIAKDLERDFEKAADDSTIPGIPIVIVAGHASFKGSNQVNDWYSLERAHAVASRFDKLPFDKKVPVFICAYGNRRPACAEGKNDTKGAKGNQRAEISVALIPQDAVNLFAPRLATDQSKPNVGGSSPYSQTKE
jgi:outer membrane protein OmpA-like peptidoglycan-associated protein